MCSQMIKLYVDDKRPAPDGWVLVTSARDAIIFIEENYQNISHISFDGYLSDRLPHTGKDVIRHVKYISDKPNFSGVFHQPRENYTCHSADQFMNDQMNTMLDEIFGIAIPKKDDKPYQPKSTLERLRNSKGRR